MQFSKSTLKPQALIFLNGSILGIFIYKSYSTTRELYKRIKTSFYTLIKKIKFTMSLNKNNFVSIILDWIFAFGFWI